MSNKLTENSRFKEVFQNPIGFDVLSKLLQQMNINEAMFTNPIMGNLPLKRIAMMSKKTLGDGFVNTLLTLLNSEPDVPDVDNGEIKKTWWKQAVFYQIYPRSFQDSNEDGVGDIQGIINRLDYLKELGIDAIWLSPIYDSPNDDNGYDIRDYYSIMKEFGTMDDFDHLLTEIHRRDMKVIMDLVVNHTSDEHAWFQAAIKDTSSQFHDYYIFKKSDKNTPPNNWTSFFSGSAWNYYEENKEWGLHLFSKKQMDLNWDNERVRIEIKNMIRWWLEKGVDGFRLDVINYISKSVGLPDGNVSVGKLMGYYGIEHYFYGPKLHQYLKELRADAFEPYHAFTVGETPGVGREMGKLLTADSRKELDMIFSFDHLEVPGHDRFEDYQYDLNYLKQYMCDWMENYGNSCWMSLFYENHDNTRMISKVNSDPQFRKVIAKLLAMLQLTLKGTPFIYQGQEIGSINKKFRSIKDIRDVESINMYNNLVISSGEEAAMNKVLCGARDHGRTPMQWSSAEYAGFSNVRPWIDTDEDYKEWNVEKQLMDEESVLNFYKKLIQIRKENQTLIYGEFISFDKVKRDIFTYYRQSGEETFYVECNLCSKPVRRLRWPRGSSLLLSNYSQLQKFLRPYEANLYRM